MSAQSFFLMLLLLPYHCYIFHPFSFKNEKLFYIDLLFENNHCEMYKNIIWELPVSVDLIKFLWTLTPITIQIYIIFWFVFC